MSKHVIRRVWETVHEPRVLTLFTVVYYMASVNVSLAYLFGPVNDRIENIEWLTYPAGIALLAGGLSGSVLAWRGQWRWERVSALSVVSGHMMAALIALAIHHTNSLLMPATTFTGLLIAAMFGATRFMRVVRYPWAEGSYPADPEGLSPLAREAKAQLQDQQNAVYYQQLRREAGGV